MLEYAPMALLLLYSAYLAHVRRKAMRALERLEKALDAFGVYDGDE